jgi:Fic family protein
MDGSHAQARSRQGVLLMMTLRQWSAEDARVPLATTWTLEELGRALGMQELFTRQSPQKLKVLREHALIESAVSSNRIEGVEVDDKRIGTLMFGAPVYRDRNEEEVAGYQKALRLIHESGRALAMSQETIKRLHQLARGDVWDAGRYKEKTEPIIERRPVGDRVRFMPVKAGAATEKTMAALVSAYDVMARDRRLSPLVLMAGVTLDFLCIHPFRDGNGRTARLLTLLLCYHAGAEAGRYISLERIIEQNKERYYETLQQSSAGWHEGRHNPWPFVNYMLWILKEAYREFEQRVGDTAEPRGAKAQLVRQAIERQRDRFSVGELERQCPGVGRDWIRAILRRLKEEKKVRSFGHGAGARWERVAE